MDYDLTIRDLQSAWTDTVQQAMALCSALGAVYGLDGLPQTAAPAIDWGDGVLYDRARIWAEQRELVDAGLLRPELALAPVYGRCRAGAMSLPCSAAGVRSPRPTMLQKVR